MPGEPKAWGASVDDPSVDGRVVDGSRPSTDGIRRIPSATLVDSSFLHQKRLKRTTRQTIGLGSIRPVEPKAWGA